MTEPTFTIHNGNCIEVMRTMANNSVDSIVTDPPYELGFMGKSWDSTGIAFNVEVWTEALRVLKPGGHLLAFSGSRTYHRMAVAIEDAGFQIRDQIMWIYGSGFPKSLNVGKHLDDWQGWGTALKPAHEPIVLARKPLIGTVAANVLKHGTGGLNIDGSRVGSDGGTKASETFANAESIIAYGNGLNGNKKTVAIDAGRFPANLINDGSDEVVALFPTTKGTIGTPDSGSAARFFYCAKASKRDRNEGLDGFEVKSKVFNGQSNTPAGNAEGSVEDKFSTQPSANYHPTVKPTDLMRYLVKLITPPNGIVLDPFTGSGSTGKGAVMEGFNFIGIELDPDYVAIATARIQHQLDNIEVTLFTEETEEAR